MWQLHSVQVSLENSKIPQEGKTGTFSPSKHLILSQGGTEKKQAPAGVHVYSGYDRRLSMLLGESPGGAAYPAQALGSLIGG